MLSRVLLLLVFGSLTSSAVERRTLMAPSTPLVQPKAPFRFLKEEKGGTTPKLWVRDAAGRSWIVKWGKEIHGDLFASRLSRSLGYHAVPTHLVRRGRILNARGAQGTRAADYVGKDGSFRDGRFKLVDPQYKYVKGGWRWDGNPFLATAKGRRELNGLKLLMLLVSNWDAKDGREGSDANTAIFTNSRQSIYAVDDWGASMGGWGNFFTRDKWDCKEFAEQNDDFVKGIDGRGFVQWGYGGKHEDDLTHGISPADVRWFLSRLTRSEVASALAASGVPRDERHCMQRALNGRLRTLERIARLTGRPQVASSRRDR